MVLVTFVSGSVGGVKLDVYNPVPLIILKLDIWPSQSIAAVLILPIDISPLLSADKFTLVLKV